MDEKSPVVPTTAPLPSYVALCESGGLTVRAALAERLLQPCRLCPRECAVDRPGGETGMCCTAGFARVASAGPHFGEERCLVGRGGSGTIFFGGCNLACVYCQNHDISRPPDISRPSAIGPLPEDGPQPGIDRRLEAVAPERSPEELADIMLELQDMGCENINLVTPTHVIPQILAALVIAAGRGLRLPLVYNSGGYDAVAALRLLDGVVDIYMPDMKYADEQAGLRLSGVPDYVVRNRAAVWEMHRQVGDLVSDNSGTARRGLLVRHLVLPGQVAAAQAIADFLATSVSRDTYLNLMDQYRPACEVLERPRSHDDLDRRLSPGDYVAAVERVLATGLWRLDGL